MKKKSAPQTPAADHPVHVVLPRQRAIKNICLQVEKQFAGRLAPEPFALRVFVLFAFYLACNAIFYGVTPPYIAVPPYVQILFYAACAFSFLTLLARRFRDLGKSGANVLQILIPLFVMVWIGDKLPSDAIRAKFEAVMWFWPAVTLIRLFFQPSAPDPDAAP